MRIPLLILLLVGAPSGCSSVSTRSAQCSVSIFSERSDSLFGLLWLEPPFESQLRSQLPPDARLAQLCWYTRKGELWAFLAGDGFSGSSYRFALKEGAWTFLDELQTVTVPAHD